jgi:hypothetical protein
MTVSKADDNEQIDADILQCKEDVLRARDIMPPYDKKPRPKAKSQETGEKTSQSVKKGETTLDDTSQIPIETIASKAAAPAEPGRGKTEIPKFDLAEDIMAEQRKVTSIRRKAPGKKPAAQSHERKVVSTSYKTVQQAPSLSKQDEIITEIVARDIARLCGGNTSGG